MKALVTGGAGFIGSHIVDELLKEGLEVVVIDNLSNGNRAWVPDEAMFYEADMLDDDLEDIFSAERPDYVFHQAAQISVAKSMTSPLVDARMNILGTINVLQCAVASKAERIIYASSAAVYGVPETFPLTEEHALHPTSFYGISKVSSEEYIRLFSSLYGLDYSIFRYANVYGPRQRNNGEAGVITIFLDQVLAGLPLTIYGDGTQTRDFIFVTDIARACIKSLALKGSTVINLGTGQPTSVNTLAKNIMKVTATTVITNKMPAKNGDIPHSYLNNSKARVTLDWQPETPLDEGLLQTCEHLTKKISPQGV